MRKSGVFGPNTNRKVTTSIAYNNAAALERRATITPPTMPSTNGINPT